MKSGNPRSSTGPWRRLSSAALVTACLITTVAMAQPPQGGGARNARQSALLDLTGQ